jgi:hypothetical protein
MEGLCADWFDTVSLPNEAGHEVTRQDLRIEQHYDFQNDQVYFP